MPFLRLKKLSFLFLLLVSSLSFATDDCANYFEIYNVSAKTVYGQEGWFNKHFTLESKDYYASDMQWCTVRDLRLGTSLDASGYIQDQICTDELAVSYRSSISIIVLPDLSCLIVPD